MFCALEPLKLESQKLAKPYKRAGLFCKAAILQQKSKYAYGYKFNERRMLRQKILLPINDTGVPAYKYMESYMKYLEQQKLRRYKDFIDFYPSKSASADEGYKGTFVDFVVAEILNP